MELTRDEILRMEAGEKLNSLIFVNVFRQHEFEPHFRNNAMCSICGGNTRAGGHPEPKDYSGDIAAAFDVVDMVYRLGFAKKFVSALVRVIIHDYGKTALRFEYHANAHQQCRAALLAVMEAK